MMWPRKLLDIDWSDLLHGAVRCLWPRDVQRQLRTLESSSGGSNQTIVCLSVRTGLDLLLQALQLPKGSEVIMTAITIPDMIAIVKQHGLVPVPLDLDFDTLSPSVESLENAWSEKSRLILVAHLFGTRMPLAPLIEFADRHQLLVVEDCAQSFCGRHRMGIGCVDASLISFGPIKTATSLGGAVVLVRDNHVLRRMRQLHAQYPIQKRRSYAMRLAKYAILKLASHRFLYRWIFRACRLSGRDPDALINSLAKNFGKGDLTPRIRQQPCGALVSMLTRRWQTYEPSRIEHRTILGIELTDRLKDCVAIPGSCSKHHSYWVFPIMSHAPEPILATLRLKGFDATTKHNLTVLDAMLDGTNREAPMMTRFLQNVIFLPIYPEMTLKAVATMADTIRYRDIEPDLTQRNALQKSVQVPQL